ncbi:MAG: glycerophosphodiester phosphodiesterase [bacterium]|nr:glycerophosphodiester phosphodiesterase [bacterium]
MEIWSHRGRSEIDELGNSFKGLISTYRLGISGIEVDVCFTEDRKAIIYHPGSTKPDLTRLTWPVIENSIFNVMDLNSFLDLATTLDDLRFCIDIKQDSNDLVETIVKAVIDRGLQKRVYLTAFQCRLPGSSIESNVKLLLLAKMIDPKIKTHMIVVWPFNIVKLAKKYKPDAISIGWLQDSYMSQLLFKSMAPHDKLAEQIVKVQEMGIKVWAGIFNGEDDLVYFIKLGVDGIFTDNPKELKRLLQYY